MTTPETFLPSAFVEEPIETIESPELKYSLLNSEGLDQDSMLENNPYLKISLIHSTLDDLSDLSMSGRETPPPAPDSMRDCSEDIQIAIPNSSTEPDTRICVTRSGLTWKRENIQRGLRFLDTLFQFVQDKFTRRLHHDGIWGTNLRTQNSNFIKITKETIQLVQLTDKMGPAAPDFSPEHYESFSAY